MKALSYENSSYHSPKRNISVFKKIFPSFSFYSRLILEIFTSASRCKRGVYTDEAWIQSSYDLTKNLESIGINFDISGIENIQDEKEPAVIIGNHMSSLETIVLPLLIHPIKPVTFVIKKSLLEYPIFKHTMRSRNPVGVGRTNPREDLKTVLTEGAKRLDSGCSIIVFPQTTRSHIFNEKEMSSIGVKLAKRTGAPIIPLALKTDAWGNGNLIKDIGKIDIKKSVHFAFGKSIKVEGKGTEEQKKICDFISSNLKKWQETE
ncbi:MAG: 1-acyl-sn-glycerol-3-phosphate acyltransferase [Desulfotalea sp.]